jgi:hypothetical protein
MLTDDQMSARIDDAIAHGKQIDDATAKAIAVKRYKLKDGYVQRFISDGSFSEPAAIVGGLLAGYEATPAEYGAPTLDTPNGVAKAEIGILGQYLDQWPQGRGPIAGWSAL